jgi:hypothetical protein
LLRSCVSSKRTATDIPRAEILSKQAPRTQTHLHPELAGKIETNRKSGDKLRVRMVQIEVVIKMLKLDFNVRAISAKRRNIGNPWLKRGIILPRCSLALEGHRCG